VIGKLRTQTNASYMGCVHLSWVLLIVEGIFGAGLELYLLQKVPQGYFIYALTTCVTTDMRYEHWTIVSAFICLITELKTTGVSLFTNISLCR